MNRSKRGHASGTSSMSDTLAFRFFPAEGAMRDPEIFPPIKPDHAAAIGYVAAHWSLVEEHLAFIIYSLLGLQAIPGHAVTAELSTLQRISTISAFVSLTGNQAWIDTWDDITKTLDNLRNRRNDAVHSTWRVVGPEHWHMRVKAKGRVSIKQGAISTTSLMSLSNEILDLEDRIAKLTHTLLSADAGKIINQLHPPGWITRTQALNLSLKSQALIRNPKRKRQQRRRSEWRNQPLE
jgi:hypothetical protein